MPDNANNVIVTKRLRLEPFALPHAAALLAYYERNRAHLETWEPARAANFYTEKYHADECEAAVVAAVHGRYVRFAVFESDGDDVIGIFNLWEIRPRFVSSVILGYSLDERYQGRGYATEAGEAVVRYAFDVLGLHRVEAAYQPTNARSGRVLRRLGFTVFGYAPDLLNFGDGWLDHVMTQRLNDAWRPPA